MSEEEKKEYRRAMKEGRTTMSFKGWKRARHYREAVEKIHKQRHKDNIFYSDELKLWECEF